MSALPPKADPIRSAIERLLIANERNSEFRYDGARLVWSDVALRFLPHLAPEIEDMDQA
jgi:hypothetical protein